MAQKKTYIYRIRIGNNGKAEHDFFMFARNGDVAIQYCQNIYRDKHYNFYKATKVGISHTLQETGIISDFEAKQMIDAGATRSEAYAERNDLGLSGILESALDKFKSEGISEPGGESVQPAGE